MTLYVKNEHFLFSILKFRGVNDWDVEIYVLDGKFDIFWHPRSGVSS